MIAISQCQTIITLMNLTTQFKNTFATMISTTHMSQVNSKILITDSDGIASLKSVFTPTDFLHMQILCIVDVNDMAIYTSDIINKSDVVYFISSNSLDEIIDCIKLLKTHAYICFKNVPSLSFLNYTKQLFSECDVTITSASLSHVVVSDYCAYGKRVLDVIQCVPIMENIQQNIQDAFVKSADLNAIHGTYSDSVTLVTLDRSYDEIVYNVVPFRYRSALAHYNVKLCGNSTNDIFYLKNKNEQFTNISAVNVLKKLSDRRQQHASNSVEHTKIDEEVKQIKKHIDAITELMTIYGTTDMSNTIALERMVINGDVLSDQDIVQLQLRNEPLYNIYISKRKNLLHYISSVSNMMTSLGNSSGDTLQTYIPKIRMLMQTIKKSKAHNIEISKVFIYVGNFVCYEEIAEVEEFNKTSQTLKFCLLSDSVKDYFNYNPSSINDANSNGKKFMRIQYVYETIPKIINGEMYCEDTLKKLEFVKKTKITFIEEDDIKRDKYKHEIHDKIASEYNALQLLKPTNTYEENEKKVRIIKLTQITDEYKDAFENKTCCPINPIFDQIDSTLFDQELDERGKAIDELCKSVYTVKDLTLRLHDIVARQSLMLNDIELNITNACEYVKDGNSQLIKAEEHQKNSNKFTNGAIATLVGINAVLLLVVGIMHHKK
jgi:hypothetical protein